jgi:phosphatidylglycerophosphatase GEP4
VLPHLSLKPSYSCIKSIRTYFASLRSPVRDGELIIVGDRIFTDIVMANRMASGKRKQLEAVSAPPGDTSKEKALTSAVLTSSDVETRGPLAVWTTGTWEKESMAMRWCEKKLVERVRIWTGEDPSRFGGRFIRELVEEKQSIPRRPWYYPPSLFSR